MGEFKRAKVKVQLVFNYPKQNQENIGMLIIITNKKMIDDTINVLILHLSLHVRQSMQY